MTRPSPRALIVVGALLALVVALVLWLGRDDGNGPLEASGTVEASETDLGFQVPGTVEAIAVDEGDRVAAGDTLARLDAAAIESHVAAARAALAAARARLAELEHGFRPQEIVQARAGAEAASERFEEARLDAERARALYAGEAISRRELERAEAVLATARGDAERTRAQLDLVREGPRAEQIAAQRASVEQSEAGLRQAEAMLDDTFVRAPFGGIVTIRHREPGETVPAGAPVVTVMDPDDRWVLLYVREDAIGRVSIGQPARVSSDSWSDREYEGRVTFIASEAEFTPANVQTEEERVKLVYQVKVQVTGDPRGDLKVGTPADVRLLEADE
ncbi:MAG TPA: HlyD family efflux transporter periplasmic adaptor subunit [Gemmatimonadota bacterium]|jgi:HlyD family secretion protein